MQDWYIEQAKADIWYVGKDIIIQLLPKYILELS